MLATLRRKFSNPSIKDFYDKYLKFGKFDDLVYYEGVICSISAKRCMKKARNSFKHFHKSSKNLSLNGIHMEMIFCPRGTFEMGHVTRNDNPPRQETIERAFLLGETEVTQELYQAVMGINPSNFQNRPQERSQVLMGIRPIIFKNTPQKPVEGVSWGDAILFCNELSKLQGLDECYTKNSAKEYDWLCDFDKNGYRLPTEKEWEYAAKAGTENEWAGTNNQWEDEEDSLEKYAVYRENSKIEGDQQTHPVKSKLPNEWGFYDMSGNVMEWCWDKYRWDMYEPENPSGDRVIRGGCWDDDASSLRSALRLHYPPGISLGHGIRVCRSLVE